MSSDTNNPYPPKRGAITPGSWLAVRLSTVAVIIGAVIYGHGLVRNFMEEQREAFRDIHAELRAIRSDQQASWRIDNMERWAGRTRWENRDKAISIPEPRDFWSK